MPSSPRKKPEASSAERIEASGGWWPRPESNQRHTDFQSAALPTELLGRAGASGNRSARKRSADYKGKVSRPPRSVAFQHSLHREIAGPPNQKKPASRAGFHSSVRCGVYLRAGIIPSSQMLCLRVSGMRKRPSTKHTAGTVIGEISALRRPPVAATPAAGL